MRQMNMKTTVFLQKFPKKLLAYQFMFCGERQKQLEKKASGKTFKSFELGSIQVKSNPSCNLAP